MTRDTKVRVVTTITGWILAAIIQAFSYAFYLGRLTEKVDELGKRVERIETHSSYEVRREKTNEVNR